MSKVANETFAMNTFGQKKKDEEEILMVNSLYDRQWGTSPKQRNGQPGDTAAVDEREKFLNPVRLDPGWDGSHGPDKNPDEQLALQEKVDELERHPPVDKCRVVYLVMVIHGIGILMPWNMFITAQAYFEDYKLNSTEPRVMEYRRNFMSYLGIAAQYPNLAMNAFNLFVQCGGGTSSVRIAWSIMVMVVVFIVTVALGMLDTSSWTETFFWITIGSVVILNMCCGIYQNSAYGVAAKLPMKYTNAVVLGNNLSGTVVALINIMSIAGTPNLRTSAIYYFVTAIVVLLIAFDAYFVLPLTKFYRHYDQIESLKMSLAVETHETCCSRLKHYWSVFKEIWVMCFNIFFVFFVSLALFPAIQSNIKKVDLPIPDKYWHPIFTFLNFNLFAMLGNMLTELVRLPGPRWVWIPIVLRGVLFIPFFLMCNYRPEERDIFPPVILNDYIYIVGAALMAFTSGYFSSLCMMYGPKQVAPEKAGTAGMMMAFFLVLGITVGVQFSLALSKIIDNL